MMNETNNNVNFISDNGSLEYSYKLQDPWFFD